MEERSSEGERSFDLLFHLHINRLFPVCALTEVEPANVLYLEDAPTNTGPCVGFLRGSSWDFTSIEVKLFASIAAGFDS